MTDPIADMLTRIRNAVAVKKPTVVLPFSKLKFTIAQVLEAEQYISKAEKISNGNFDEIKIILKYTGGHPAIHHIKRLSKPGQRIYVNGAEIPKVLNNYGLAILSTPKGVMTSREAAKQRIGGELMCEIW